MFTLCDEMSNEINSMYSLLARKLFKVLCSLTQDQIYHGHCDASGRKVSGAGVCERERQRERTKEKERKCVCVRERERERGGGGGGGGRERDPNPTDAVNDENSFPTHKRCGTYYPVKVSGINVVILQPTHVAYTIHRRMLIKQNVEASSNKNRFPSLACRPAGDNRYNTLHLHRPETAESK